LEAILVKTRSRTRIGKQLKLDLFGGAASASTILSDATCQIRSQASHTASSTLRGSKMLMIRGRSGKPTCGVSGKRGSFEGIALLLDDRVAILAGTTNINQSFSLSRISFNSFGQTLEEHVDPFETKDTRHIPRQAFPHPSNGCSVDGVDRTGVAVLASLPR